jgi:hypothetical protein
MLMRLLYALQQQQPFAFLVGTTHSFSLLFPFSLSNQKTQNPTNVTSIFTMPLNVLLLLFLFLSPQPLFSASLPRNPEGIHFHFPPSFFKHFIN